MGIEDHRVSNAPPSVYYIPNFINKDEEELLMSKVYSAPKPKWTQLSHRRLQNWGGLPHPKGMIAEPLPHWLQTYAEKIAKLGIFESYIPNHVLVNEYLPGQGIMPHEDGPLFYPTVSTISLGSHTMLDFYYHLGHQEKSDSKRMTDEETREDIKNFHETENNKAKEACSGKPEADDTSASFKDRHFLSILLEPRSLIMVCDDMYKIHLHGITEKTSDTVSEKVGNLDMVSASEGDILERKTRVSLTIRYVPKILKAKLLFGKR